MALLCVFNNTDKWCMAEQGAYLLTRDTWVPLAELLFCQSLESLIWFIFSASFLFALSLSGLPRPHCSVLSLSLSFSHSFLLISLPVCSASPFTLQFSSLTLLFFSWILQYFLWIHFFCALPIALFFHIILGLQTFFYTPKHAYQLGKLPNDVTQQHQIHSSLFVLLDQILYHQSRNVNMGQCPKTPLYAIF